MRPKKEKEKRYNNFGSITKFNHVVPKIIEVINATTLSHHLKPHSIIIRVRPFCSATLGEIMCLILVKECN